MKVNADVFKPSGYIGKTGMNDSGEVSIQAIVIGILAVVIGAILVSSIGPTSIDNMNNGKNATGWNSSQESTWDGITMFIMISFLGIFAAIVYKMFV